MTPGRPTIRVEASVTNYQIERTGERFLWVVFHIFTRVPADVDRSNGQMRIEIETRYGEKVINETRKSCATAMRE